MDFWSIVALVFAGAFFALVIVALFYLRLVRPRLLNLTPQPTSEPVAEEMAALQESMNLLTETLIRHSALVARLPTAFSVQTSSGIDPSILQAIQAIQQGQTSAMQKLEGDIQSLTATIAQEPEFQFVPAQQDTLDEVRGLITEINEGSLSINAALEQQRSAINGLATLQARDADQIDALKNDLANFLTRRQATRTLQDIDGIGPTYARRLAEAGIYSLDDLTQLTPDQISDIVKAPGGLRVDAVSWIGQALEVIATRDTEANA